MLFAHKIRLDPTNKQRTFFAQCVGTARFAYNWALTEWQQQYQASERPNEMALRQLLNGIKGQEFPWMLDVPKTVPQQAIKNLGTAFHRFFAKLGAYPKRKKKFRHDSARLDNGPVKKGADAVQVNCKKIRIPKLGWVRMTEAVRFAGQIKSCTLSRTADDWFVSLMIDTAPPVPTRKPKGATVGVDLGVKALATLSTGETIEGPKAHKKASARLKRLDRVMARRKKGSANRQKAAATRAKAHQHVANIRTDFIHKLTTDLSRRFETIVVEDLHVSGMVKNHHLARAISDMGFYEFRRQLTYKVEREGGQLCIAPRFYPSSKTCSQCGHVLEELPLSVRDWPCPSCGVWHDRDQNAALNLKSLAGSSSVTACGVESAGFRPVVKVKLSMVKQEANTSVPQG